MEEEGEDLSLDLEEWMNALPADLQSYVEEDYPNLDNEEWLNGMEQDEEETETTFFSFPYYRGHSDIQL